LHDAADEVGAGSQTAAAESAPRLELAARKHAADLLVIGSSRRGRMGQILAGGVALRLLPGAPCAAALPPAAYAASRAGLE
jgi:nucleotide-binding universal stress UspA family protein